MLFFPLKTLGGGKCGNTLLRTVISVILSRRPVCLGSKEVLSETCRSMAQRASVRMGL